MHCTATAQDASVEAIKRGFAAQGWRNPGYHYIVDREGWTTQLLALNLVANGVKGYNEDSVHVAWIGGIDANGKGVDNRTDEQKEELRCLLKRLRRQYPTAQILGHRDISPDRNGNGVVDPWERIKECPCFDAITEYKDI